MRWVAPTEKDEANHQLEKRLWDAADQFRANSGSPKVTKREREVLELAAHGQSSKRIAYQLGISESTANFHIASIKRKFKARTRSQAIAQALQTGIIR